PIAPGTPEGAQCDTEWSVNLSDTDQRTMSTQELVDGWKAGTVTADAYVWKEGMADWVPLLECGELAMLLGSDPRVSSPSGETGAVVSSADPIAASSSQPATPFAFSAETQ